MADKEQGTLNFFTETTTRRTAMAGEDDSRKRTAKETAKDTSGKVRCADCQHFKRDTEGISRNVYTGEYFMGTCTAGLHPDTPIKQFADHLRECKKHAKN